ncbi:hypothetical protein AB1Y20_015258 [Prymnesium parvum]|uniref:ShKT domain-containing protein n=1 Tax=Prymnesium parvum TaxID=97485 RepID=A0AB34JXZ7_PRYPA
MPASSASFWAPEPADDEEHERTRLLVANDADHEQNADALVLFLTCCRSFQACVCYGLRRVLRWRCFCMIALVLCASFAPILARSPNRTKEEVHELEAELRHQRQQLVELQKAVTRRRATSSSLCIDKWEVKFPAEVDKWSGHSCAWKQTWGQCDEFKRQCERTCGVCQPDSSASSTGEGEADSPTDGGDSIEEQDDSEEEGEEDEESSDELRPLIQQDTAASRRPDPDAVKVEPASRGNEGNAPPAGVAEEVSQRLQPERTPTAQSELPSSERTARAHGFARTHSEVLERYLADREKSRSPSLGMVELRQVSIRHAQSKRTKNLAAPARDPSTGDTIDDSYEGPTSARPASKAPSSSSNEEDGGTRASERASYVTGDENTVISPGSECGIPTAHPAVHLPQFSMGLIQESSTTEGDGRRLTEATYVSTPILMDVGEVAHIKQTLTLLEPAGALGLITKYRVDVLHQAKDELRAVPAHALHLRRASFSRTMRSSGDVGRATSCAEHPIIMADEMSRGKTVAFPHPFGILVNKSTSWDVLFHAIRTEDLRDSKVMAVQCACMRVDVGSPHCCPHRCRFPTRAHERAPSIYRLSLTLTWLLGPGDNNEDAENLVELRPLSAFWIAVTETPRTEAGLLAECVASNHETEFDVPSCREKMLRGGQCSVVATSSWARLGRPGVIVSALGMPNIFSTKLTLHLRSDAAIMDTAPCEYSGTQPIHHVWPMLQCSYGNGKELQTGHTLKVETTLNNSAAVLGVDVGFVVWIEF